MNQASEKLMNIVVDVIKDKKGHDVTALNLEGLSLMADYFVICHGNSTTQVQSIASEVKQKAEENEIEIRRMEGYDGGRWVLMDLSDVIVHIFHREDREYYNLERLWSDATIVEHA